MEPDKDAMKKEAQATSPDRKTSPKDEEKTPGNDKRSPRDRNPMIFVFDDQSPEEKSSQPPRDLPGALTERGENASSPTIGASGVALSGSPNISPRAKRAFPGPDFLTQSSPARFVSLEEIMQAADGVTNMALAHEIAVDNDFRFQKAELPAKSLEKQVREIMHKAFWDSLDEKLKEDPPDYSHALILIQDVKDTVLDLLLPQHQRLRSQIDEVLDMELISQKADHEALDVAYYAKFVISMMAALCAPVRDEQVAELREITEVVPLFKAIFGVLDIMKVDMANFTIQQIRPYIQHQSVDYEKTKFKQILKQQEENNRDGLQYTKSWLHRAGEVICQQMAAQTTPSTLSEPSTVPPVSPPGVSPVAILNTAYMELLQWQENWVFPETLLMDEQRFLDLCEKMQWLGLVSSVLMVTYNTVGDPILGVRAFKEKLKNDIAAIISETPFSGVTDIMPTVSQHVVKEVQRCLKDSGYQTMSPERVTLLQGQIEGVSSPTQPVHQCLRERLLKHIQGLLSLPGTQQIQVPPGFAAMAEEFSHVYGQFLRLVSHNRAVYGAYYADIIGTFLRKKVSEKISSSSAASSFVSQ